MSKRYEPPPPPPLPPSQPRLLYKQCSWSPDAERDEAWLRRKKSHVAGIRRSQSLTDEVIRRSQSFTDDDLDDLKGSLELGFGFETDSPDLHPKLSDVLPALPLYCAVNRQYSGGLSRSSSESSIASFSDSGSTSTIIDQGKLYIKVIFLLNSFKIQRHRFLLIVF